MTKKGKEVFIFAKPKFDVGVLDGKVGSLKSAFYYKAKDEDENEVTRLTLKENVFEDKSEVEKKLIESIMELNKALFFVQNG